MKLNFSTKSTPGLHMILLAVSIFQVFGFNTAQAQTNEQIEVNGRNVGVDFLDQQIIKMMDDVGIPGLNVAVINNNEIVFDRVYGYKNLYKKKKANKNTIFEACSLSKSFLVFAVHQLVDEGKLDLDKPLYQYLKHDRLEYDARYKLITGRMILSHSSGIENWESDNQWGKLEILTPPGEKHIYSGEGYNYLSLVVQSLIGQTYEEYIADRVMKPLKLKRTFLKFEDRNLNPFQSETPTNYAVGHNAFNQQFRKWKNDEPVPSSSINMVARDYAKVIISTFNKKYLSDQRVEEIMTPQVSSKEGDTKSFWGPGFMIHHCDNDTLISQGGSNAGFKGLLLYSPSSKSGFVYFSNNDRGWAIGAKLNELTTNFDCNLFESTDTFEEHYPSMAIDLLKIYREQGKEALYKEVTLLANNQQLKVNTLNEIGAEFRWKDEEVAIKLLKQNIELYPELPDAYCLLGEVYEQAGKNDLAYQNLLKADELNFNKWEIDESIADLKEELDKRKKICAEKVNISANTITVLEAENYCRSRGIQTDITKDTEGGGELIGWTNLGDWLEYDIEVKNAGSYIVELRVASPEGRGQIDLFLGTELLSKVENFPVTKDMDIYTDLKITVDLEAGPQTLRINVNQGNFDMNWMKFYSASLTKK